MKERKEDEAHKLGSTAATCSPNAFSEEGLLQKRGESLSDDANVERDEAKNKLDVAN